MNTQCFHSSAHNKPIILIYVSITEITYFFLFLLLALLRRKWQSTAPFTKSCRGVLSSCRKSWTAFFLAFCTASLHVPSSYSTPRILDTLYMTQWAYKLISKCYENILGKPAASIWNISPEFQKTFLLHDEETTQPMFWRPSVPSLSGNDVIPWW